MEYKPLPFPPVKSSPTPVPIYFPTNKKARNLNRSRALEAIGFLQESFKEAGLRLLFCFKLPILSTAGGRWIYRSIFALWIAAFLIRHRLHLKNSVGRNEAIILASYASRESKHLLTYKKAASGNSQIVAAPFSTQNHYLTGILISCPARMRAGFVICGFACRISCTVTLNRAAIM